MERFKVGNAGAFPSVLCKQNVPFYIIEGIGINTVNTEITAKTLCRRLFGRPYNKIEGSGVFAFDVGGRKHSRPIRCVDADAFTRFRARCFKRHTDVLSLIA